ncbi:MAG: hypothetical protein GY795_05750 [Desulfobacterales bacterium]|nr:hypothetical protein [Desulfobacterales bacterium]
MANAAHPVNDNNSSGLVLASGIVFLQGTLIPSLRISLLSIGQTFMVSDSETVYHIITSIAINK